MICLDCLGECDSKQFNDGFYYSYGSENGWHDESYEGSDCCGAEVVQGKVFLDKSSWHKASKDHHTDNNGKVVVKKGEYYLARIIKGYYIEDGTHKPIIEYYKRPKRYFSPEMLKQLRCPELTPTPTH